MLNSSFERFLLWSFWSLLVWGFREYSSGFSGVLGVVFLGFRAYRVLKLYTIKNYEWFRLRGLLSGRRVFLFNFLAPCPKKERVP